jgi:hypothetical protein
LKTQEKLRGKKSEGDELSSLSPRRGDREAKIKLLPGIMSSAVFVTIAIT